MSASHRLAAFAVVLSALIPVTAHTMDDYVAPSSSAPMAIKLCGEADGDKIKTADCKQAGYDKLVAAIDKSFNAALVKTPANIRALIKRDQTWFNEMILEAVNTVQEVDEAEIRENFGEMLRQRALTLNDIAAGFGRAGLGGKWANAFGGVTVTAGENGVYRVAADVSSNYGSDKHWQCKLAATVKPGPNGWLSGTVDRAKPAEVWDAAAARNVPAEASSIKLRRQGDTLRLVLVTTEQQSFYSDNADCAHPGQITGTYFASGKQDGSEKADIAFVAPTFDCTRPETATDEEICSDPDLAENDQRLNRAWKALLPRLDDATRRALMDDQRHWVHSQAEQFPEFLHPGWEKQTSQIHYTVNGRDHVDRLQRERIALIEGFDDKRLGLAGVWLGYNAIINITVDKDGSLEAKGWKWDQGDWKAGCDYEISGDVKNGAFRSDDKGKNPDTLERDHAMLIVNRIDDAFAKKRSGETGADEMKCKRSMSASSTARLFPARASPDINDFGASIR